MNKTMLIIATILLIALPSAIAGTLFDDEVQDNVYFTVSGVKHVGRYYQPADKISLKAHVDTPDEETTLIDKGDCEEIKNWKYCFDSVENGYDEETGDPMSTWTLRIIESGPSLSIDMDVSEDNPLINEAVEVTVTITNDGNERASNIAYIEKFPSSVKISGSTADSLNKRVAWSGSINDGDSATFTYTLKFQDFITYESTGEASYVFNNKVNKVQTDTVTYEVQTPYLLERKFSTIVPAEGEEVIYTLNITNNDSSDSLSIQKIELTLPSGSVVTKRDLGIKEAGTNVYTYTGSVGSGSAETISIRFKNSNKGKYEVKTYYDFRLGSVDFTDTVKDELRIGISNIVPAITIEPESTKGGKEVMIEAKITNEGDDTISKVWLDLTSDILDTRAWRTIELEPGDKHYAYNKILNAPNVEEETEYYITLTGSYKNDAGKTLDYEETKTFTVLPSEKVIEMTPEFEIEGNEVTVTLTAKNIATYTLNDVSLIDTVPGGFSMVEGDRYIDVESLATGADTSYTYTIKIPDTYTKDSFEITHTFNGNDKDDEIIMFEKTSTVDISGATLEESTGDEEDTDPADEETDTTDGNTTAEEETADTDEKKPGIFKRMWSWIKGLFSGDDENEDDQAEEEETEEDLEIDNTEEDADEETEE